jgi:hypothetical protein
MAEATRADLRGGVTPEEAEVAQAATAQTRPPSVDRLASEGGHARVTDGEKSEALVWFLSAEDDYSDALPTKTLEINVAPAGSPERFIPWTIRAIDQDELLAIRRQAGGSREQRRRAASAGLGGDVDPTLANLHMVVAATVDPDLRAAAVAKGVTTDPAYVLKHRLAHKPGLIQQIAAEVMLFSGFDDEDVRDAKEVRAAGN